MAQINPTLGDFKYNAEKILYFTQKSLECQCHLVVFPEACLFGYNPLDLLEIPSIVRQQEEFILWLKKEIPDKISILVGTITSCQSPVGKRFHNSAVWIQAQKPPIVFSKQLLPTYDVFDEGRHLAPGDMTQNTFQFNDHRILVTICEDIWGQEGSSLYNTDPLRQWLPGGLDIVVNLSASPFTRDKAKMRLRVAQKTVKLLKSPLVYVNLVGGQDELIFDGGSFAMDSKGCVLVQSAYFKEDLSIYDTNSQSLKLTSTVKKSPLRTSTKWVRQAIVLGIKDFVGKTNFKKVHLGLSGGIDSALVACLAVEALGPQYVTALSLPSPFNSKDSLKWARQLTHRLGISFKEVSIWESYQSVLKSYEDSVGQMEFGVVHENIQSRLRSLFLMTYSNQKGSLLLNTSNKSELAAGYSTLYGDLSGGLCPIGDLLKKDVYSLCHSYNETKEIIPKDIIQRPPSAELRPDQKDEDSLPSYSQLDASIHRLVEEKLPPLTDIDREVLEKLYKSEFKRWQSPPILKVTNHGFGRGRRFPVAGKFLGGGAKEPQ